MDFVGRLYRPVLFMAVAGVCFVYAVQYINTVCEQNAQTWWRHSVQYNNYTGQQNLTFFLAQEEKYLILIELLKLNSNV